MILTRNAFEKRGFLKKYPELQRLVDYCDAEKFPMKFCEDIGKIGIKVATQDGTPLTDMNMDGFTLYMDTTMQNMSFLGESTWDAGMKILCEQAAEAEEQTDLDIIDSLGTNIGA